MSANPTICLIPPRTPTTELVNQEDLSRIPSKFAVLSRIDPSVSAMSFSPGASLTPTSTGISESLRPLTTLNAANDPSRPPSPVTIGTYTPLHYRKSDKYKHIFAIHADQKTSTLSHDAAETPSFIGFRNLMVLVLSTPPPDILTCGQHHADLPDRQQLSGIYGSLLRIT